MICRAASVSPNNYPIVNCLVMSRAPPTQWFASQPAPVEQERTCLGQKIARNELLPVSRRSRRIRHFRSSRGARLDGSSSSCYLIGAQNGTIEEAKQQNNFRAPRPGVIEAEAAEAAALLIDADRSRAIVAAGSTTTTTMIGTLRSTSRTRRDGKPVAIKSRLATHRLCLVSCWPE